MSVLGVLVSVLLTASSACSSATHTNPPPADANSLDTDAASYVDASSEVPERDATDAVDDVRDRDVQSPSLPMWLPDSVVCGVADEVVT